MSVAGKRVSELEDKSGKSLDAPQGRGELAHMEKSRETWA